MSEANSPGDPVGEGILFKGDGYYCYRPGRLSQLMGPFETKAQARFMRKATLIAMQQDTKIPAPSDRYRHANGIEYTVVGITNEHSDRAEYTPKVVYQGDNGRLWDKPLEDFMRKMKLIATNKPVLSITDEGPAQVMFTDKEGRMCACRETLVGEQLTLGIDLILNSPDAGYPALLRPVMRLSRAQAGVLSVYLDNFYEQGSLDDQPLLKPGAD